LRMSATFCRLPIAVPTHIRSSLLNVASARHKLSFIRLCEELVKEDHATYIAGAKRPRTRFTA